MLHRCLTWSMVRIDKAVEGIPARKGPCYVGRRSKSGLPRFQGQVHSEEPSFVFRTGFGY